MEQFNKSIEESISFKLKRVSWSAIFAGVILAIIMQLLLSLLGIGIGLASFSPATDAHPFSGFGTGAIVWWFISILLSLFAGGLVAGWLANTVNKTDNIVHGLLTWGIFALMSLYVLTSSVGHILGGMGQIIGKSLQTAGSVIKEVSPEAANLVGDQLGIKDENLESLKKEAATLLRQTGKKELQPEYIDNSISKAKKDIKSSAEQIATDPSNADQDVQVLVNKLFDLKENMLSAADQDALANIISKRTGKSKQESSQIVSNWAHAADQTKVQIKQTAAKAKEEAKRISDEASDALGKAAILGFFALLLGAATAVIGATVANKRRIQLNHTLPYKN